MPNFLLIPTSMERLIIEPILRQSVPEKFDPSGVSVPWQIERCGFGLVAAAANTARLIAQYRPERIVLLGIAGSLSETVSVGCAAVFGRVTCHGIGVGDPLSIHHQSADQLGWKHCEGNDLQHSVGDSIRLSRRWGMVSEGSNHHLISVAAGSANEYEAHRRSARFTDAIAEDMEGFAVALACESAGTSLEIVRGISNRAGDRNHDRWQIRPALLAAAEKAIDLITR